MTPFTLRPAEKADLPHLAALYAAAFPGESLMPLVEELMAWNVLALVAVDDQGEIVGHVLFSPGSVGSGGDKVALLGPLAVAPARQRRGVGRALIGEGLARLAGGAVAKVLVLGDPAYYGRSGFVAERGISPPYPLPEEWQTAWQSRALSAAGNALSGPLRTLPPWRKKALWAP